MVLVGLLKYPKGEVEELFKHLPIVAAGLAAAGLFILATGSRDSTSRGRLTNRSSFWIGLVQRFLRAVSRLLGLGGHDLDRTFLRRVVRDMPRISVCAGGRFDAACAGLRGLQASQVHELSSTMLTGTLVPARVGMVLSFLAGLLALRFLSAILEKGRWRFFGCYCMVAAVAILAANYALPAT